MMDNFDFFGVEVIELVERTRSIREKARGMVRSRQVLTVEPTTRKDTQGAKRQTRKIALLPLE